MVRTGLVEILAKRDVGQHERDRQIWRLMILGPGIAIAEGMRLTFLLASGLMLIGGCVVFAGGIGRVACPANRD
ncbi:hypothetical protein CYD30_01670 [Kosakonia cowanii]|nr:hypothetical protein CYD30_01670 [Kosakonia cowanii]